MVGAKLSFRNVFCQQNVLIKKTVSIEPSFYYGSVHEVCYQFMQRTKRQPPNSFNIHCSHIRTTGRQSKGFHKMTDQSRGKFMKAVFGKDGATIDTSTAAALLAATYSGGDPQVCIWMLGTFSIKIFFIVIGWYSSRRLRAAVIARWNWFLQ